MIYSTGTISINGNAATGTGTNWTAAASQIRVSQTIIVLSNPVQMFQITAINSATSLTVTPAASPALSGQKYGILVTDSLSVDGLAQSISQLIKGYDENIGAWESFASTTANQNITVTINGTSLTIPALGKLLQKGSNGALPVASGGTGATAAADARANLGLVGSNDTVPVNMGGTGSPTANGAKKSLGLDAVGAYAESNKIELNYTSPDDVVQNLKANALAAFRSTGNTGSSATSGYYIPQNAAGIFSRTSDTWFLMAVPYGGGIDGGIRVLSGYGDVGIQKTRTLWDSENTAVDSSGYVKKASPVIKIFSDGIFETNSESEGCTVTRQSDGQYLIEGCIGLNSDAAWGGIDGGFDIPKDRNGQSLIWLDYKVNADGSVLVKTYHRTYPEAPAFARNEIDGLSDGDAVDIPADQFVSVRVEMPSDSIWNKKQEESKQAMHHDGQEDIES